MMSSDTSAPESMTFFAAIPSGVPALTAERSISPVEICGMPYASLTKAAWVPLPAPGGPSNMSRIGCKSRVKRTLGIDLSKARPRRHGAVEPCLSNARRFCPQSRQRSNGRGGRGGEQGAHPLQILLGVDARRRRAARNADDDAVSVPQRAQLLKSLETLDRRRTERRVMAQEAHPVGVEAVMAIQRQPERNFLRSGGEIVARPWDRRAAEVQRVAVAVEHDLDHVRIERLGRIVDQVHGCGNGAAAWGV